MITISVDKVDIRLTPAGYLGDRYFDFTAAIKLHGGWSIPNGGKPYYLVSLSQAEDCIATLTRIKIPFTCTPEVETTLASRRSFTQAHLEDMKAFVKAYNKQESGLTIYPFQVEDISRCHLTRRILLANPVGTGKTMIALLSVPADHKVVVVCPSNVAEAWIREIVKWGVGTEAECEIIRKPLRWEVPTKRFAIYSSSNLPDQGVAPVLFPCNKLAVLVDEAHEYLNPKAQRTKRLSPLLAAVVAQDGFLIPMSASPVKNRYGELLAFLETFHLLTPSFGSKGAFIAEYRGYKGNYGMEWDGPINPEDSRKILDRVMIRRERKDIVDEMPTYRHDTLSLTLTPTELRNLDKEGALKSLEALAPGLNSLRGPGFEELSRICSILAQAKARHIVPTIKSYLDNREPLVVMSRSKLAMKYLFDQLPAKAKVALLTGDQSSTQREEIRKKFFAGEIDVLLCTIASCYQGIDLTRASTMLFLDRDFVPEINMQCRGRIDRYTQRSKSLRYVTAVANHALDTRLDEILTEKEAMLSSIYNQ